MLSQIKPQVPTVTACLSAAGWIKAQAATAAYTCLISGPGTTIWTVGGIPRLRMNHKNSPKPQPRPKLLSLGMVYPGLILPAHLSVLLWGFLPKERNQPKPYRCVFPRDSCNRQRAAPPIPLCKQGTLQKRRRMTATKIQSVRRLVVPFRQFL